MTTTAPNPDARARTYFGTAADPRTAIELLDATQVAVVVPATPNLFQQISALTAVRLLAKLFPRIRILGVNGIIAANGLPAGATTLAARLQAERWAGYPRPRPIDANAREVTLAIGDGNGVRADVYIDATAWTTYLGDRPGPVLPVSAHRVGVGAVVAAARGVARLVALATGGDPPLEATLWSALTLSVEETVTATEVEVMEGGFDLEAALVGLGSIGGAAAWTLAHSAEVSGVLDLVDDDRLDLRNVPRATLATYVAAAARRSKVAEAEALLRRSAGPTGRSTMAMWRAWLAGREPGPLPLILSAVDSVDARRQIQDAVPFGLVNAACHPSIVMVSGHRTGTGPCVYCLHVPSVLDAESTTTAFLQRATNLSARVVQEHRVNSTPLTAVILRGIEKHRRLGAGALANFEGRTLDELHREHLMYGWVPAGGDAEGTAVAAAFVTALAGALLAGEAIKHANMALHPYRLGPDSSTRYIEDVLAPTAKVGLDSPQRWPGSECLCQSSRRQRLLAQRYPRSA